MKKALLIFLFTGFCLKVFASGHGLNGLEVIFEAAAVLLALNFIHLVFAIVSLSVRRKALKIVSIIFGSMATGANLFITVSVSAVPYVESSVPGVLALTTFISLALFLTVILVPNKKKSNERQ